MRIARLGGTRGLHLGTVAGLLLCAAAAGRIAADDSQRGHGAAGLRPGPHVAAVRGPSTQDPPPASLLKPHADSGELRATALINPSAAGAPLGETLPIAVSEGNGAAEIPQPPLRDETARSQPLGDGQAGPQDAWTWQTLPDGLIYHSYLAGPKEPRFASQWVHDPHEGWLWDVALGGRVGLFRYGTEDAFHPEGWQLDMEGAAFPRLDCDESLDLMSCDYRFGIPLTYGTGPYQVKFAAYHLSSHLGDEWMLKHPDVERINYSRNALVWGNSYYCTPNLRAYGEVGWAFYADGGARPWEFQVGLDYSPAEPTGRRPVPFFALNGYLREDVNFGGSFAAQTGYQWRGETNHLFRAGMEYYVGKSDQLEFFRQNENKIGLALWYDF